MIAPALLVILAAVALLKMRDGTLQPWLAAKFFNAADPNRLPGSAYDLDTPAPKAGAPTGGWLQPTSGTVSSGFGVDRGSHNHAGVDIAAPKGTPVYAAQGGRVQHAGYMGDYGKLVIIDHGGGYTTRYAHLDSINVRVGQTVAAGQQIGRVGTTGRSTGNHLHFEIRQGGTAVNPAPLIGVA